MQTQSSDVMGFLKTGSYQVPNSVGQLLSELTKHSNPAGHLLALVCPSS